MQTFVGGKWINLQKLCVKGFWVSFRHSIQFNYIIVVVQMERIAALGIVGTKYKKNVYVSAEAI